MRYDKRATATVSQCRNNTNIDKTSAEKCHLYAPNCKHLNNKFLCICFYFYWKVIFKPYVNFTCHTTVFHIHLVHSRQTVRDKHIALTLAKVMADFLFCFCELMWIGKLFFVSPMQIIYTPTPNGHKVLLWNSPMFLNLRFSKFNFLVVNTRCSIDFKTMPTFDVCFGNVIEILCQN